MWFASTWLAADRHVQGVAPASDPMSAEIDFSSPFDAQGYGGIADGWARLILFLVDIFTARTG